MTSTKIIYLLAAVVPFGCVALAAAFLLHSYFQKKQQAQALTVRAAR